MNDEGTAAARLRRTTILLALAALLLIGALVWLVVQRGAGPDREGGTQGTDAGAPAYPEFASDSPLTAVVSRAPLDPNQAAIRANVLAQIRRSKGVVSINTDAYAASYVKADDTTPAIDVRYADCQHKGAAGEAMLDARGVFDGVPIPDDAQAAVGSDGHLSIWRPSTDQLWEFWQAKRTADGGWEACWGGRIDDVSSNSGGFAPPFGVSASGLSAAGLMITLEEARAARIEHALGLVLLDPGKGWRYPATRGDGSSTAPGAPPEGTRLRLDPTVDVDVLKLTPFARAVAKAAQTYGFIVMDRGGAVVLLGESGRMEHVRTGTDPWAAVFGQTPAYRQFDAIPWDRLQVIRAGWGRPADPSPSSP